MSKKLHPLISAAAKGELPDWAAAGMRRREHMARVARLLKKWSKARGEKKRDVKRWIALGYLHDVLREAKPNDLRKILVGRQARLPGPILHGPAAAVRLSQEGVTDEPFLIAVAYHSIGSAKLDDMGRGLYVADYVEPGRRYRPEWRAEMRRRMPGDLDIAVRGVLRNRMRQRLSRERPIRPETVGFWNVMVKGQLWASVSEV